MHFMMLAFTLFAAFTLVHFETPFVIPLVYPEVRKKALVATRTDAANDNAS